MARTQLPAATDLRPMQIYAMAVACSFGIASLYYNQPLLPLIGATFDTPDTLTGQLVTLGQISYAVGLLLFVPLGDRFERRRLILALLCVNTLGMLACAVAPSFAMLAIATVGAGLTTVTPQIIIPAIAGMAVPERRGQTVAVLMAGTPPDFSWRGHSAVLSASWRVGAPFS